MSRKQIIFNFPRCFDIFSLLNVLSFTTTDMHRVGRTSKEEIKKNSSSSEDEEKRWLFWFYLIWSRIFSILAASCHSSPLICKKIYPRAQSHLVWISSSFEFFFYFLSEKKKLSEQKLWMSNVTLNENFLVSHKFFLSSCHSDHVQEVFLLHNFHNMVETCY